MSEARTALEDKVVEAARAARDEVEGLVTELVACDTTARMPGDPARDEEKLQRLLAARLEKLGTRPDLWEPAATGAGSRSIPAGLDFAGRPQLAAVVPGAGSGRSLLLNGHIDAVDVEPRGEWLSDPFKVDERDGYLYGRGVNDMKGGIACLVVALETLRRLDVRLAGDLVFCTVTDEESSGAGGHMAVAHGVSADAGIAAEATDFDAWVTCRGTVTPTITVAGRAGHAEIPQADWREGGAVNAVEKLMPLLAGVQALREEWRRRPDHRHPLLAPGDVVPTIVKGGTWMVTYPASCDLTCDITYLPAHVNADGTGKAVEAEVTDRLTAAVAGDPWFAEHPLRFTWSDDVVPAEMPADHPLVTTALGCAGAVGRTGKPAGLDSWHDAATFTAAGTPTFSFGPDGIGSAHAVNEHVSVDGLADFTAAIALTAMRWCGVA
ncbi:MAG TPA: M20/M25/M40 family metallo-hydrolase [Thermoleophilia bacterium]|nr:M20/M25/M40 family metallo-hydrolase [Thermoleophilia bacterium]